MKYYIVPAALADILSLRDCRYGTEEDGFLCNIGDLACYGLERAVSEGSREITHAEAKLFVKQHK